VHVERVGRVAGEVAQDVVCALRRELRR
jgi:hypothetical protein